MAISYEPFHHHTSLEGRMIRLLQVSRHANSEIHCSLVIKSLDKDISYEALSYVWGEASKKQCIICDGKRLDVTDNLHSALVHVAQRQSSTLLWVDAICIDQKNIAEKSSQVRMMTEIYAQAQRVVFWLGDEERGDREAYALAESIASAIADTGRFDCEDESLYNSRWASLSALFNKPWFSRIWIVQEFLTAKSGIFVCGGLELRTSVVTKVAQHVNNNLSLKNKIGVNTDLKRKQYSHAGSNPGKLAWLLEWRSQSDGPDILQLLLATTHFDATDRRDKIFALCAMSDDVPRSMIDYSKSLEELLWEFAVWMTKHSPGLPSPIALFSHAVNNIPSKGIPSWVPDWINQEYLTHPIAHFLEMGDIGHECHLLIEPSKRIRVRGKLVDHIETIVWSTPGDTPMNGLSLDALALIFASMFDWHQTVSQLAYSTEVYPNEMDMGEALWRALIWDGAGSRKLGKLKKMSAYLAWQACLRWSHLEKTIIDKRKSRNREELTLLALVTILYIAYGLFISRFSKVVSKINLLFWCLSWMVAYICAKMVFRLTRRRHSGYIKDLKAEQKQIDSKRPGGKTQPFEECFAKTSIGRRFCKTERGYLGWVSRNAQEGDSVVAFLGCRALFTLREIDHAKGDGSPEQSAGRQYRLTGDSFIYGLMKGEALQMDSPIEDVVIV